MWWRFFFVFVVHPWVEVLLLLLAALIDCVRNWFSFFRARGQGPDPAQVALQCNGVRRVFRLLIAPFYPLIVPSIRPFRLFFSIFVTLRVHPRRSACAAAAAAAAAAVKLMRAVNSEIPVPCVPMMCPNPVVRVLYSSLAIRRFCQPVVRTA